MSWIVARSVSSCWCSCWMTMPNTKPSASRGSALVEVGAGEHVERSLAHVVDIRARLARSEDRQLGPFAPRVRERVVEVVVALVDRSTPPELAHEPELLVVADVREIPHERRHERRDLAAQVIVVERREEPEGPVPGVVEMRRDQLAQLHARPVVLGRGSGSALLCHWSSRSSAGQRPRAT